MSLIGEGLEILELIDKGKNARLYKQLGEYVDKVRVLQIENDKLSETVRDCEAKLRFKGVLERVNGHVFVQGDDEEICPRCAETDLKPIHLIPHHSIRLPGQKAWCPVCQIEFQHFAPFSREQASGKS